VRCARPQIIGLGHIPTQSPNATSTDEGQIKCPHPRGVSIDSPSRQRGKVIHVNKKSNRVLFGDTHISVNLLARVCGLQIRRYEEAQRSLTRTQTRALEPNRISAPSEGTAKRRRSEDKTAAAAAAAEAAAAAAVAAAAPWWQQPPMVPDLPGAPGTCAWSRLGMPPRPHRGMPVQDAQSLRSRGRMPSAACVWALDAAETETPMEASSAVEWSAAEQEQLEAHAEPLRCVRTSISGGAFHDGSGSLHPLHVS
jgi:hypothetical protein